jgi:hypothetical protein
MCSQRRTPTVEHMLYSSRAHDLIHAVTVAVVLGVDVATLERWRAHRAGPQVTATSDGRLLYSLAAVEAWCDRLGDQRGLRRVGR